MRWDSDVIYAYNFPIKTKFKEVKAWSYGN